ncbi:unnamed protein product [Meloidogyne enterolobii]|uniref:Uncharacterized protein n=1 Tax=Meloidogyne enterolobii TaxID=390850 RepID=A0ACB1A1K1_MELEN
MPNLNKRIRSNSMESSSSDNTIVPNLNLSPDQLSQIAVMVAELLKPSIETIIQTTVSEIFKQNSNNLNNINTINKNNQNHNQNSPLWGQPPSFITDNNLFSKMATYAAENPDTINKKSKIAVVERMPFISEEDDKRIVDEIIMFLVTILFNNFIAFLVPFPQFPTMYLLAVTLVLLSYNFCINYVGMPTH